MRSYKFLNFFYTLVFIAFFSNGWGQALLQWNTFGNVGTETIEPSVFNVGGVSACNLVYGSSVVTPAANANRFGGSNWSTSATSAGAVTGNNYIEFTLTPSAGCSVTPTSFVFNWDKSGTGPVNVALRSSADGFAADLGVVAPVAAIGTANTITIAGLTNLTTATVFRIYGYGASATTGTGGFDIGSNVVNVQLNGTTSCNNPCTTPTITISPLSQTLCANNAGTISVSSTASSPTYSWEMSSDGATWVAVSNGTPTGVSYGGTTSASLTATGTASLSEYYYHCIVTDGTCTATSATSSLSIYPVTTTTLSPSSQTVCMNTNASFTIGTSASSPTYQWQMSSATGGPWVNVANGTPAGVSYTGATSNSLTANGTQTVSAYYYRCLVTDPLTGCTATTTTGTLKIGINFTSQPYTAVITSAQTATFVSNITGGGTSYQWQVNSGGGFSNVTNGGVYSGATTSMLTVTNPPTSMNTYSYQCVITNTCTSVTSTAAVLYVSAPTATNCPRMTGVFVNACNGTCNEGDNEILFFNSGAYSIPVSPANIGVYYGSVPTTTTNYTGSFTTNAALTSSLNALASSSCSTLFVDASVAGTIPANSTFMIVRNTACYAFDFSSYCPANTVYVLYSTDPDWSSGGNFTNGGNVGALRYFVADFTGVAGGCSTTYNYQPNLLTLGADGDAISFQNGGGAASSYFNNGCTPPALILPVQLIDFHVTRNNGENDLVWKVASEENLRSYIIEKSPDGLIFVKFQEIYLEENANAIKIYSLEDPSPYKDITYYRLSTKENDGTIKHHKIISLEEKTTKWDYNYYQQQDNLYVEFKNTVPKNSTISLYDLSGKLLVDGQVKQSQTIINTSALSSGIYFVKITSPYKIENFKVIISK